MTRTRGFYDGIEEADYHDDRESLSVSGAKILVNEGPAAFAWARDHRRVFDHFDVGHAAHKLVLGVGDPITVIEADDWRSAAARKARDEARTEGCVPLLAKDHEVVQAMAARLRSHKVAMTLLSEGRPEVSIYAPDERTGVMRRGRVDWLHPRLVVDYKTTATSTHPANLAGRYGTVRKWGYDQQAAWYLDMLRDLGHPALEFVFIFQSKTAPYPVTVATVPDDDLWEARDKNADALSLFRTCTETGEWPDVIPDDSWACLSLFNQTYTQEKLA